MRHFLILQYACVCWSWFVCLFTWLPCLLACFFDFFVYLCLSGSAFVLSSSDKLEFAKRCGIPAVNKNVWKIYGNMIGKKKLSGCHAKPGLISIDFFIQIHWQQSSALGNISSKILVRLIVLGSYRLYYLIAIPGPLLKQKGRYWGCKIYVKIWSTLRKLRWVVASTCLLKSLWTNPGKVVCYSAQLFFFCKRAWKPRWFQCDAFGVDSTPCWRCFFRV